MKVKYIAEPYGHDEFEKEINDFIKDKKIIDIKFQENFSISEDYEDGMKSALIMYEDYAMKGAERAMNIKDFEKKLNEVNMPKNARFRPHLHVKQADKAGLDSSGIAIRKNYKNQVSVFLDMPDEETLFFYNSAST